MIDLANIFNHLEGWSKQEVYTVNNKIGKNQYHI